MSQIQPYTVDVSQIQPYTVPMVTYEHKFYPPEIKVVSDEEVKKTMEEHDELLDVGGE